MRAFSDPSIDGIVSTIGGDDSIRILPYVDINVIQKNSKVFMGFSDTTVSHFLCMQAGLGSFYGPSIMAGFAENGGLFPYMQDAVKHVLFSNEEIGKLPQNKEEWTVEYLDWADPELQRQKRKRETCTGWHFLQGQGTHFGRLIGGCVEVIDWLRGTPVWPDHSHWKNAILFLETSEEAPAPQAVQRMLRALASVGVLKEISAILFGRPGGQIAPGTFIQYENMLVDFVNHELGRPELPLVAMLDFGHTDPIMVLPYGRKCVVDCDQHAIMIPENAVV